MTTMYDSISATKIPADAEVAAGYVDGSWPNYSAVCARVPNAQHVSITVHAAPGARVIDCETGDATPAGAAQWAAAELRARRRPTIYCNRSTWPAVIRALQAQGIAGGKVDFWIADWTGTAHLLAGTVATQWANDVDGCDLSETDGVWPGTPSVTTTPAPAHQGDDSMVVLAKRSGDSPDPRGQGAVYLVADFPYGPKRWLSSPAAMVPYTQLGMTVEEVHPFILDRMEEGPII